MIVIRFIDKLKAFFFNEQQVRIINIGDLIQIPGREYFKDNKEALELIEEYKKECLEILSQKKTIVTKDISNNELISKKDMYINLLLNIVMKEDYYTYENQELLDNKIILLKLKLYLEAIIKIENETIARLIALLELEKSRKVPIRNRNTLKTEIDNLKISLYTLISQKTSIKTEIDNYLTHISISDNRMYPSKIEERRDKTIKYASHLIDVNEIYSNKELTDNNIYKQMAIIALLETKIEEYLYTNKPSMWYLNGSADSIKYTPDLNYREAKTIKNRLLQDLNKLEEQYMLYHKFGRNLVTYDDWYSLYSAKFRILTFDISENYYDGYLDNLIFGNVNEIESTIYASIITHKQFNIARGANTVINAIHKFITVKQHDLYTEENIKKMLANYFKEDSTRFEFYGTKNYHISVEAFRLLLSLDSKKDFYRLLNSQINIRKLPNNPYFNIFQGHDGTFVFDDIIPLSTILEVIDNKGIPDYYKCLKELYTLYKEIYGNYFFMANDIFDRIPNGVKYNDIYLLPEGIKIIQAHYEPNKYYLKKIINEVNDKIVIFPKSLRAINGAFFKPTSSTKGMILNDELERIGYYSQIETYKEILDIPSSITWCDKYGIEMYNIKGLRFKDYTNSKILENPKELSKMLVASLTCKTLNYKNHRTKKSISAVVEKIDVDVKIESEVLKYKILESNGNDVIKIDLNDIKCYATLKDEEHKKDFYPVNSKELRIKFTELLLRRIRFEEKKLENNQKALTKIKRNK